MKRTILATLLAVFTAAASASAALRNVKVYPNPFRPSQGHNTISFDGITNGGQLKIYNSAGRLVFETTIDASAPTPYPWDVKNSAGNDIASGVYIYFLESEGDSKRGKLGIVR